MLRTGSTREGALASCSAAATPAITGGTGPRSTMGAFSLATTSLFVRTPGSELGLAAALLPAALSAAGQKNESANKPRGFLPPALLAASFFEPSFLVVSLLVVSLL